MRVKGEEVMPEIRQATAEEEEERGRCPATVNKAQSHMTTEQRGR